MLQLMNRKGWINTHNNSSSSNSSVSSQNDNQDDSDNDCVACGPQTSNSKLQMTICMFVFASENNEQ